MKDNFKSGFVAIIGRPNVGKSTLMNHLIGQKIAITSKKPQTTRNRIQTVYTCEDGQIVFLDTPGIHKAKNKLGEYMVNVAEQTLRDVVTRYFGGTLLGVGGLVRAYSEGAKIAVQAAKIKIMAQSADFLLRCGYDFFGKLEYYLNEHGVLVLSTQFGEDVSTAVRIRKEEIPAFEHGITELSSGKLVPQLISDGWNEM